MKKIRRLYPRDYALTIKQVIALLQAKQSKVATEKLLNPIPIRQTDSEGIQITSTSLW